MSITAPKGFVAAGLACGIKASGAADLALVATDDERPVPGAGVFTRNMAAAAPVSVSRAHLEATGGLASAVIVSSGNANAATGERGVADAEFMCAQVGEGLGVRGTDVLICQTGLIGIPLPMTPIEAGIPRLVDARAAGREAAEAAEAAGVSERTVRRRLADSNFESRVDAARVELIDSAIARLSAGAITAVATLCALMTAEPPGVRLNAARAVLDFGIKFRAEREFAERLSAIEGHLAITGGKGT